MPETRYCTPLLVSDDNVSVHERIPISDGSYNEAYIQNLAFAYPSCLPISELDGPGHASSSLVEHCNSSITAVLQPPIPRKRRHSGSSSA
jgi:hypothetical protein